MTLIATITDKQDYAKIGGALDDLSASYNYVAPALLAVDNARDPLANSGRMAKYVKGGVLAKRLYDYLRIIQKALDEKTRDGALLKFGLKVSIDIAGKFLGRSLTTHPYYAYHKAMLDALADALNASRNSRAAVDAYRRAVTAADSDAVASEFKRLESRKVDVVVEHFQFKDTIGVAADIAGGQMSDDFARKKIEQYGITKLNDAMADLEAWRAHWAGLSFDAAQLLIMTNTELNVALEAMNKVKDLISTLMGGSNTNRVAGYAATNNIDWEMYDQIVNQKKPDGLVMDPVAFAQGNCDKATAWCHAFAEMCDFVRGTDVVFSTLFNRQLDSLNRVLYG